MIFQPPFPPTEIEAEAIINIGFMFADIIIILLFLILMIYLFKKVENQLPIIIVYLFSLLIGIEGLTHSHTHFSPTIEIFFLLFQTIIFIISVFDYYENEKRKKGI